MRNSLKTITELNFEDEQGLKESARIIKSEYYKKALKSILYIAIVLIIAFGYLIFGYLPYMDNTSFPYFLVTESSAPASIEFSLDLTLGWSIFSTSIFLIIYFIRLIHVKFTPSLIRFIERETKYAGFEFKRRIQSAGLFVILNAVSIALLFYLDSNLIRFDNSSWSIVFKDSLLIYLLISLALPIIWVFRNDKFVIKVKDNVFVLCDLHYNFKKNKNYDPNLVGIILTSNRLCSKFDRSGKFIYSRISKGRWLVRNESSAISPYLHFEEYSVPYNFQKQFLNIVLALNEWENNYAPNLDSLNYYFSKTLSYYNYKFNKHEDNTQLIYLKFLNI
ncbi:MAG: hypothetical protein KGD68_01505 [Candidatus Lokiarchaeota archaeon]|nr:hypothetical protein [Candidatus Lokiarchaeota archaeon]